MTPEQWFAESNPDRLLAFVNPPPPFTYGQPQPTRPVPWARARRLMLFGCACGRMMWDLLPTPLWNAIETRERFADGRATEADLRAAAVRTTWGAVTVKQHAANAAGGDPSEAARGAARALAARAAGPAPPGHPVDRAWEAVWNATFHAARATQAAILRDIFPPPGYTPRLDPGWLTPTAVGVARHMDATGDFAAAPILADALQDAGCDDDALLQCCRVPGGVHARGNWAADLVLGRE